MSPNDLRDGIFNLNTRRFGTVAELMIMRLVQLTKGRNIFHDLYDDLKSHRVEVKFSTVRRKSDRTICPESVLDCIRDELAANRSVSFLDDAYKDAYFDCNIQQVKRNQFEVLYYGLFFSDLVLIFRIESAEIGPQIFYSDKQHKGNKGEGQFHINNKTIQIHLENYLYKMIKYDELLDLLKKAEPQVPTKIFASNRKHKNSRS